jgi:hypothetical protein
MADMRIGGAAVATPVAAPAAAPAGSPLAQTWAKGMANAGTTNAKFAADYAGWAASLNPQERAALQAYRTPGVYYLLNQFLRRGEVPPQKPWQHFTPDGLRQLAYQLNQALKKAPVTKEPITVYRSVVLPTRYQQMGDNLKGQQFDDRGFMSTTVDPTVIKTFEQTRLTKPDKGHNPVAMAITIPAGTSLAYIEAALGGAGEREALLPLGEPAGHVINFTSNVETVDGMRMVSGDLKANATRSNNFPAFPPGFTATGFELKKYFDS